MHHKQEVAGSTPARRTMSDTEKLQRIEQLVRDWDGKTGHDRCWYYPDLFRQIAGILGLELTTTPELPARAEFEEGCRRYQEQEYGDGRV